MEEDDDETSVITDEAEGYRESEALKAGQIASELPSFDEDDEEGIVVEEKPYRKKNFI